MSTALNNLKSFFTRSNRDDAPQSLLNNKKHADSEAEADVADVHARRSSEPAPARHDGLSFLARVTNFFSRSGRKVRPVEIDVGKKVAEDYARLQRSHEAFIDANINIAKKDEVAALLFQWKAGVKEDSIFQGKELEIFLESQGLLEKKGKKYVPTEEGQKLLDTKPLFHSFKVSKLTRQLNKDAKQYWPEEREAVREEAKQEVEDIFTQLNAGAPTLKEREKAYQDKMNAIGREIGPEFSDREKDTAALKIELISQKQREFEAQHQQKIEQTVKKAQEDALKGGIIVYPVESFNNESLKSKTYILTNLKESLPEAFVRDYGIGNPKAEVNPRAANEYAIKNTNVKELIESYINSFNEKVTELSTHFEEVSINDLKLKKLELQQPTHPGHEYRNALDVAEQRVRYQKQFEQCSTFDELTAKYVELFGKASDSQKRIVGSVFEEVKTAKLPAFQAAYRAETKATLARAANLGEKAESLKESAAHDWQKEIIDSLVSEIEIDKRIGEPAHTAMRALVEKLETGGGKPTEELTAKLKTFSESTSNQDLNDINAVLREKIKPLTEEKQKLIYNSLLESQPQLRANDRTAYNASHIVTTQIDQIYLEEWTSLKNELGDTFSQPKIQELNFASVRNDPDLFTAYKAFVKTEHSSENLAFLTRVEAYNSLASTLTEENRATLEPRLKAEARSIYNEFVKEGAPQYTNINTEGRRQIEASLTTLPNFRLAEREVRKLVEVDAFNRFKIELGNAAKAKETARIDDLIGADLHKAMNGVVAELEKISPNSLDANKPPSEALMKAAIAYRDTYPSPHTKEFENKVVSVFQSKIKKLSPYVALNLYKVCENMVVGNPKKGSNEEAFALLFKGAGFGHLAQALRAGAIEQLDTYLTDTHQTVDQLNISNILSDPRLYGIVKRHAFGNNEMENFVFLDNKKAYEELAADPVTNSERLNQMALEIYKTSIEEEVYAGISAQGGALYQINVAGLTLDELRKLLPNPERDIQIVVTKLNDIVTGKGLTAGSAGAAALGTLIDQNELAHLKANYSLAKRSQAPME